MFGKSTAPAKVPTDTIIPFRFFDDTPLWKAFILYSMFVFDDVLDAEKLRESLEALAKRDGWRRLGARMRRDSKGNLEYHAPSEFTEERQALTYTHIVHDICAADHPIASKLPSPSSRPAVVCDPDDFRDLFCREGGPVSLEDYLNQDIPQLGLHIVSFKDKTLVTLYWPHTLMDALGKKALLNAWMLMLQGRSNEIVSPQGGDSDPLADLGKNPTEIHKLAAQRLSMFGLAQYGISNVLDLFRSQENRMVCVPGSFIADLQKTAVSELEADGIENPFLSEGDVLCAWWTRLAISHMPQNTQKTIVLNNAYSLRTSLEADLLPKGAPYVSNAIGFINVLLPVQAIFEKPLSYIAAATRSAIKELGSRAQVEAFTALWRESSGKIPPFFGNGGMHMITYSNWTKAKLFEVDFSAAVLTPANGNRKSGLPTYIQNNQFGLVLPNGFPIIGKDNEGNYWLSGYMNKGLWGRIEEQLAEA
ncbi:hypothetical protein TARUN_4823 [Trichoderma arundinaceum]|uniref:Uncharacterized protein n=1 Tax=Trichoderma arundinaceum TaxID=490622 RepID=A0A395NN05_TRIAR|nr:hypothetical protein TARUN_4823 [Trichoderma arundinaceum]